LKYYPLVENALWQSSKFRLEPIPQEIKTAIIAKAQTYFPALWGKASFEEHE
jgi:hypothetical protein